MHVLLHKSDKSDNMLATLTAYEFSQTNRFSILETNQIYVSLGGTNTDLELNLIERKKTNVSLVPAFDENAWKYPGPMFSRFLHPLQNIRDDHTYSW
jgi:hypothetical protein